MARYKDGTEVKVKDLVWVVTSHPIPKEKVEFDAKGRPIPRVRPKPPKKPVPPWKQPKATWQDVRRQAVVTEVVNETLVKVAYSCVRDDGVVLHVNRPVEAIHLEKAVTP